MKRSPSSRRAWIEIQSRCARSISTAVALLAEGVDRNQNHKTVLARLACRPPRGGRG